MDSLKRLEETFSHFPGIGPRQARRFVYYLLSRSPASIKELVHLIEEIKKNSHECEICHRYFIENGVKRSTCNICSDQNRDRTSLMILARDFDCESVEKSGAYNGLYFILGGTVPILDKEPERRIRLAALLGHISDSPEIKEIILSLNTTPDGEHTETIVKEAICRLLAAKDKKLTVLGRGLSTGAELEYADKETIKNALKNRT